SNSISLELPKQLKKSKYFYLDKKSNFWGAHQNMSGSFRVYKPIRIKITKRANDPQANNLKAAVLR
uniref:hypothetical protein n=1 Tax=Lactococcus lactis subsp. cremoris TaxID=1359 RepID=UPI0021AA3726